MGISLFCGFRLVQCVAPMVFYCHVEVEHSVDIDEGCLEVDVNTVRYECCNFLGDLAEKFP